MNFSRVCCSSGQALRIEYPGAIYHVTSRGNARQAIYKDDADRHRWRRKEIACWQPIEDISTDCKVSGGKRA